LIHFYKRLLSLIFVQITFAFLKMDYDTIVIIGQTVLLSIAITVGIMYCFFEEGEKLKKE